jgi:hypothetical protein
MHLGAFLRIFLGFSSHPSTVRWRRADTGNMSAYAPPAYGVAAFWQIEHERWIQLAGRAPTLEKQLDLLAALRTVRSR